MCFNPLSIWHPLHMCIILTTPFFFLSLSLTLSSFLFLFLARELKSLQEARRVWCPHLSLLSPLRPLLKMAWPQSLEAPCTPPDHRGLPSLEPAATALPQHPTT